MNSGERLGNLLPTLGDLPRRDASLWLAHSRKISSSPLVSGNIQTTADVRCRTRAPSDVRIDVTRRTINSFLSSGLAGHVNNRGENWRTTVTRCPLNRRTERCLAQRLTCTIMCMRSDRPGRTKLSRVDRSSTYRHDNDRTSAIVIALLASATCRTNGRAT